MQAVKEGGSHIVNELQAESETKITSQPEPETKISREKLFVILFITIILIQSYWIFVLKVQSSPAESQGWTPPPPPSPSAPAKDPNAPPPPDGNPAENATPRVAFFQGDIVAGLVILKEIPEHPMSKEETQKIRVLLSWVDRLNRERSSIEYAITRVLRKDQADFIKTEADKVSGKPAELYEIFQNISGTELLRLSSLKGNTAAPENVSGENRIPDKLLLAGLVQINKSNSKLSLDQKQWEEIAPLVYRMYEIISLSRSKQDEIQTTLSEDQLLYLKKREADVENLHREFSPDDLFKKAMESLDSLERKK